MSGHYPRINVNIAQPDLLQERRMSFQVGSITISSWRPQRALDCTPCALSLYPLGMSAEIYNHALSFAADSCWLAGVAIAFKLILHSM